MDIAPVYIWSDMKNKLAFIDLGVKFSEICLWVYVYLNVSTVNISSKIVEMKDFNWLVTFPFGQTAWNVLKKLCIVCINI